MRPPVRMKLVNMEICMRPPVRMKLVNMRDMYETSC